ncbi:MAG: phosphoglycerate mutase family protein [Faecalibacterium prausnitzii]
MRHGETLFNTMDVNQGQCDSPLTENGIRQAKAAKAWFDAHNVHFDAVYSSTSERACRQRSSSQAGCPIPAAKTSKEIFPRHKGSFAHP